LNDSILIIYWNELSHDAHADGSDFYAHFYFNASDCVNDANVLYLNDYGYKFPFYVCVNFLNEIFLSHLKAIDGLCMACHYENANVYDLTNTNEIHDYENSRDVHRWGRCAKWTKQSNCKSDQKR
jgi:hypothetical protein